MTNVKGLQSVGQTQSKGRPKIAAPHLVVAFRPLFVVVDVVKEDQIRGQ